MSDCPSREAPKHLSFSSLSTLADCQERFRLTRVIGIREAPSWATIGGSSAHAVTEAQDLYELCGIDNGKPRDFNEALALELEHQLKRNEITEDQVRVTGRKSAQWPDKENRKWWEVNGPAMVNRWRNWINSNGYTLWVSPDGEPGVELELSEDVAGHGFKSFVDRVLLSTDNAIVITDLKFGARKPSSSKQLGWYALQLSRRFGVTSDLWGTYWFGREGGSSIPDHLNKYLDGRLDWEAEAAWDVIDRGKFLPSEGDHCNWCGVRDHCWAKGNDQWKPYWRAALK